MRHFPLAEVCRLQIVPWGTSSACSDGAPSRMRVHAATEPAVSHPVQSVQARSSGDGHVERVTAWSVSHNASPCCAFCNSRRRSRCPPPPPAPAPPPPPSPLLALVGGAAVAERALAVFLAPFRNATSRAKVRNRGRTYDRVGSRRPAVRVRPSVRRRVGRDAGRGGAAATAVTVSVVGPF